LVALVVPSLTSTQERTGPPPEIRTLVQSFVQAANGDAAEFEAMAKAHFAPAYLAKQTAADRARVHAEIRKQFGTIALDRVMREGPEEPLELNVKGTTGTGVISLTTDPASPFKISGIKVGAATGQGQRGGRGGIPAPVDPDMTTDALGKALDQHLSRLSAEDALSGVVLVAKDGQPVFQKAYGLADRSNRIANTTATRFNVGSINKKFTEVAIGQLMATGKLAATDTIGKFFPDYPQPISRSATIEQLLRHTGGLADFFGEEFSQTAKDRFRSNADYFALVSRLAPLFEPGARNQYCNGCYITLGAIIERVSGMPYERYVAENIFQPAGMTRTGYPQTDGIEAAVALGYTRRLGDGSLKSNIFAHGAAGSAAGGGSSTVSDLLAFDNALRGGKIPNTRAQSGLGIAGGAPGTNAVLESNGAWTVIVLTNLDPPAGENIGIGIMRALARRE
jgi:CubicO group peptidase (beta-lactamase class C family)